MPKSVLCVGAHPDDLEFGVAGSVAKWVHDGAKVYYLILTNGNKGSDDRSLSSEELTTIRRNEQIDAGKILGVKQVYFKDYEDGTLEVTQALKKDIVRVIRQTKPEVVYCIDPTVIYTLDGFGVNHSDHRAAGMATIDAVFPLARDYLSFPELYSDEKLEPHKVKTLLMTNFEKSNFSINISNFINRKLDALAVHKSQLDNPEATLEMIKRRAKETGGLVGYKYAESFIRVEIPG